MFSFIVFGPDCAITSAALGWGAPVPRARAAFDAGFFFVAVFVAGLVDDFDFAGLAFAVDAAGASSAALAGEVMIDAAIKEPAAMRTRPTRIVFSPVECYAPGTAGACGMPNTSRRRGYRSFGKSTS
jgi:hypothetical protein